MLYRVPNGVTPFNPMLCRNESVSLEGMVNSSGFWRPLLSRKLSVPPRLNRGS